MVEFIFNANDIEPLKDRGSESPETLALRMWQEFENADEDMDFVTACELAIFDREVWDALFDAVQKLNVDSWSSASQALLGRALASRPQRRGAGVKARRDARLRAIAAALRRVHDLPPTRGTDTGTARSASAVLAGLPGLGMISEKTIINILTKALPQK